MGTIMLTVIDSLLDVIPAMTDSSAIKAAYRLLNVCFMEEQPTIPVCYRPEQFYVFTTKNRTVFPEDSNPCTTPQCHCFGSGIGALWKISLQR